MRRPTRSRDDRRVVHQREPLPRVERRPLAPASCDEPLARPALTPQTIVALQQFAGNANVTRALARQKPAPIPDSRASGQVAPRATPMSRDQRIRYEREAGEHVTQAMVAFATACTHHRDALRAKAKANAELTTLVIDIATGFLAPLLANWTQQKVIGKVKARGGDAAEMEGLMKMLSDRDMTKAAFTAGSKVGQQAIKANSFALFGESDHDAFLAATQTAFHRGGQAITDHLGDMTDEQVVAIWVGYSYDYTSVDVYRVALAGLLARYDAFVAAQGARHTEGHYRGLPTGDVVDSETRVFIAVLHGKPRYILVHSDEYSGFGTKTWRRFAGYVPPDIEDLAIRRTIQLFGTVLQLDPGDLLNPPPS
jgi:hypothetical protein